MTRQHAKELWDRWQWVIGIALLPLLLWAAKRYDAEKVGAREMEAHLFTEQLRRQADSLHHAEDDRNIRYLICRQDFSRQRCLEPRR